MREYTYVYEPGSNSPWFAFRPWQVTVRDLACEILSVWRPTSPERVGTLFTLPNPSPQLWASSRLQHYALKKPADLSAALTGVVGSAVCAHAKVRRAGVPTLAAGHQVMPVPGGAYVLEYPVTPQTVHDVIDFGDVCSVCNYEWSSHPAEICPGYLGEVFTPENPRYEEVYTVLKFHQQLPGWLAAQADAIYAMALEKLSEQKTSAYTGGHARGEFTPFLDVTEARGLATTGDGAGDPVPGERGDNGDR